MRKKHNGFIAIALTIFFLFITATLMAISSSSILQGVKVINNTKQDEIAYEAAETGLSYALANMNENYLTIIADNSDVNDNFLGINSTINYQINNDSSVAINYQNVNANDSSLILVTSTGTETNSNTSKTVSQLIKFKNLIITTPDVAAVAKGDVVLVNRSTINNPDAENTVWSGGLFSINGPQAKTTTATTDPSSSLGFTGSDITDQDSNLQNLTDTQLVENFFGTSLDQVKNSSNLYFYNDNNTNYSNELNGVKGKIIYIDQPNSVATLDQGITVGTPNEPVILIVNGQFKMSGFANFYGIIYLTEKWVDKFDYGNINGALIVNGDLKLKRTAAINYDIDLVGKITNSYGVYYRVSGSWKDF